ncbi:hypothetical protein Mlute_01195 [Meiothermus luteus]|jgi:hypothetical protein|uniref:Lipoprotein n=1 Tax=Meiothermus luteus TaxID=2026184 RepID=A0A399ES49_9DEIN|nr:hypothetical protein [Meiothermus luteus]RIH86625.1 hypothetical protein Mlute_01195 [Meiothermus luteus]RMH58109.1 MAG: hypothetical protein D6684_01505 [Deinococcota bacterium]
MGKKLLLVFLGMVLTACTGSSEEPIRALLAVGVVNQSSQASEVRFYLSRTLQPGVGESPRLVGSWPLDEPLVDFLYRRSLEGGNDQLWVLTSNRLRRYNTGLLRTSSVGSPTLDGFDQALPSGCSQGYLRAGQSHLLLVCPPSEPSRPIGNYQAWRIPYNATALPDPIDFLEPNLVRLDVPARLALGPGDQLLYLTPSQMGRYDFVNPYLERTFARSGAFPTDLIYTSNLALGLLDDNDSTTTDTTLLAWNLEATSGPSFNPNSNLAARDFARGAPPIFVLGTGLARFDGGFQLAPESVLSRSIAYRSGVAAQDQFLYLAQQNAPTLTVIDLTLNFASLTSAALRSSTISGNFQERLVALAFIPVEE